MTTGRQPIARPAIAAADLAFAGKSALLFGTALGSAIAIMAASPQQAWAADECGADVAGVATCNADGVPATDANPYPTGIDYTADPAEDITVILTGAVQVVTATDDGVTAVNVAGEAIINTQAGATINAYGDGLNIYAVGGDAETLNYADIISEEQGIQANSFALNGDTYVTNYGDITVNGSGNASGFADGILATSAEGVTVVNQGLIDVFSSTDLYTTGISALGGSEAVSVTNFNNITVENTFGEARGIVADGNVAVSVTSTGALSVTAADDAVGIDAYSFTGDVTVTTAGPILVDGGDAAVGVSADSNSANVTLNLTSNIGVTSANAVALGVDADAYLNVDVEIDGDVTASAYNSAYGVRANSDEGMVLVDVTGDISATSAEYDAYGVRAIAGGDISVYADGDITTNADIFGAGVYAFSDDGDILVSVTGDIDTDAGDSAYGIYIIGDYTGVVYMDGDVSAYSAGNLAYGIDVAVEGSATLVMTGDVYAGGANFNTGLDVDAGDFASTFITGDITVIAFDGFGLGISSDSGLGTSVTTDGDIYVYAYDGATGIEASSDADVTVNATGSIFAGSFYDAYGIDVDADDDAFVTVDANITANGGDFGTAINVDAGDFAVIDINGGDIFGSDLAIHSVSVSGTDIYNYGILSSGGTFVIDVDGGAADIYNDGIVYGAVDLTDNADYFYNTGTWEAYGTSYFGLGFDYAENRDTVGFSRYQGAASTTTFYSLEFFSNYGLVSGVDNQAGDSLNITGNFYGGAGSELALDVQLGGPGSIADTLVIGSASGVTEILPNDTLAALPGALNFGGILVVNSANAAETGAEFEMANVDKGFIEYELLFDAATDNWLIVGLPDNEVFELLGAMSASQDFWKRSGDSLTARWQEIRDASPIGGAQAGPGGMGRSDGWELWMQAHGGAESFDNAETFSLGGFPFAVDLTADSDWRGFQFGFDNLSGDMLWGLTMGFNQQETTFDFDNNSFDTEGWNIGGYFGWSSGGFFLNALVKGDFFEQDANFHTLPSIFSFDGTTWGVQGELGYRWEGDGWFLEPIAAVAWSTTDLDSVTTAGATIDFDDSESFRGKAGARIGGTFGSGDVIWTPYIGAYYMDEWEGDNALTFTTGITSITFNDQGRGSYGLADFGITFQSFYGLEGFVKGEWNFGGDADGGAARLGARWRW